MSWSRRPDRRRKSPDRVPFLLDKFSAQDIDRWNRFRDEILRFHWDYYNSLAYQRSQISEDLSKTLLGAAEGPFQFSKWQRIVTYKHAVEPLSLLGSLVDPGRCSLTYLRLASCSGSWWPRRGLKELCILRSLGARIVWRSFHKTSRMLMCLFN